MTRDELLRKCVDRGVADESTVSAVAHLFYVFLLSALQRGQRVEIPDFGTFGTRVIGVKRTKKIPYFEPDPDLANQVNEAYSEMKYVVVGRYEETELTVATGYAGREAPFDQLTEQVGREVVIDTHHEVGRSDAEAAMERKKVLNQPKEKPPMPKFNLKEEGTSGETSGQSTPPPTLHEQETGKGPGPLMQVLIALLILGLLTLALHFFGVIRLWGPAVPEQAAMPEPEPIPEQQAPVDTAMVPTPTPVPVKPERPVSSGTGDYTVQVSAWHSRSKADGEVARLANAQLDAFVEEGFVEGERWFRVRVGRYETQSEAGAAAERLSQILENGVWATRVGQ
jgi:septal ring-binding cell division protein DamX